MAGAAPIRKGAVLGIVLVSYLMIVLDISIVITALPKIHHALAFSATGLSWVHPRPQADVPGTTATARTPEGGSRVPRRARRRADSRRIDRQEHHMRTTTLGSAGPEVGVIGLGS